MTSPFSFLPPPPKAGWVALLLGWLTRSNELPLSHNNINALTRLLNSRAADMLLAAVVMGMVLNTLTPPINALADKLDRVLIKLTVLEQEQRCQHQKGAYSYDTL